MAVTSHSSTSRTTSTGTIATPRRRLLTVPTLAQRAGDFTNLRDSSGAQILLYDPTTTRDLGHGLVRDVFTDNKIPTSRLSSVSRKVLAYIPLPDNTGQTNNYLGENIVDDRSYMWSVRGDQILTSRQRISGFANLQTNDSLGEGPFPGELSNGNLNYSRPQIYRLEHDFAQKADRLNHLVFGYTTWYTHWDRLQDQRQNWSQLLGLTGIDSGGSSSFPVVNFTGSALTSLGRYTDLKTRGGQFDSSIQLTDVMTMTHGAHEIKAGFDLRRSRSFQKPVVDTGVQGQFNFSNIATAAPSALATSGNAFASFLLGAVDSGLRYTTTEGPDMRYLYSALFLHDNFRLSPKLTVNIGFRYDLPRAGYDMNQSEASFDPTLANPGAGGLKGALAFAGKSNGQTGDKRFGKKDNSEIGPRIGFAYAMNSKTVVRGGWGMIYSAGNQAFGKQLYALFSWVHRRHPAAFERPQPSLLLGRRTEPAGLLPASADVRPQPRQRDLDLFYQSRFRQGPANPELLDQRAASGSDGNSGRCGLPRRQTDPPQRRPAPEPG